VSIQDAGIRQELDTWSSRRAHNDVGYGNVGDGDVVTTSWHSKLGAGAWHRAVAAAASGGGGGGGGSSSSSSSSSGGGAGCVVRQTACDATCDMGQMCKSDEEGPRARGRGVVGRWTVTATLAWR
jgi:hypothetical protein